jgi:hypothetical protein
MGNAGAAGGKGEQGARAQARIDLRLQGRQPGGERGATRRKGQPGRGSRL